MNPSSFEERRLASSKLCSTWTHEHISNCFKIYGNWRYGSSNEINRKNISAYLKVVVTAESALVRTDLSMVPCFLFGV